MKAVRPEKVSVLQWVPVPRYRGTVDGSFSQWSCHPALLFGILARMALLGLSRPTLVTSSRCWRGTQKESSFYTENFLCYNTMLEIGPTKQDFFSREKRMLSITESSKWLSSPSLERSFYYLLFIIIYYFYYLGVDVWGTALGNCDDKHEDILFQMGWGALACTHTQFVVAWHYL